MPEKTEIRNEMDDKIKQIADFLDYASIIKILNKLTDYAEIITEGKLSGIINYNFQLASLETNLVIMLFERIGVLTRIFNLAMKGTKNLENEFISNIFSDSVNPSGLSSYISLRSHIENRLSNEIQLYNMNMHKSNTTNAMSINELNGHVRTYTTLSQSDVTISTKAQHGIIAASLHDAYVTLMNKNDWRYDKTYIKFFFNDDDIKNDNLIIEKRPRISLNDVKENIQYLIAKIAEIKSIKPDALLNASDNGIMAKIARREAEKSQSIVNKVFKDKMLETPFGKQYGNKIDDILMLIFSDINKERSYDEELFQKRIKSLYEQYLIDPENLHSSEKKGDAIFSVEFLIGQEYGLKNLYEKYLMDKKENFIKSFNDNIKQELESFIFNLFFIYLDEMFKSLFKIIKSLDLKKYACAFIIKRIYLITGENLNPFGYFFIKAVAKTGGIKTD